MLKKQLKKAEAMVRSGAFDAAIETYQKILQSDPSQEEARYNLAATYARSGDLNKAVIAFRAMISDMPDVEAAHRQLAVALRKHEIPRFTADVQMLQASQLDESLSTYLKALKAVPAIGACYTALRDILGSSNRMLEANVAGSKAALYSGGLEDAMLDLAATLAHPGDLKGALKAYVNAVKSVPDEWRMSEDEYIQSTLTFSGDEIVTEDGLEVMMEWERPIMERSAQIICHNHGDVLNVGFGMAIIDTAIQQCGVTSHTIIEAHPQVIRRAEAWAEDRHAVHVIESKWQDVLQELPKFDGIYFDTLAPPILPFLRNIPNILKLGGVFSYFQYMINLENLTVMVRKELEFGIEYLPFDSVDENKYYRLMDRDDQGRYLAPLFVFRRIA